MDGCIKMNSDDDFPIRQALLVGGSVLVELHFIPHRT